MTIGIGDEGHRKRFNSLFVGMCFAIQGYLDRGGDLETRFNSLFVGMCFAIHKARTFGAKKQMFQFPFRRDVLCN